MRFCLQTKKKLLPLYRIHSERESNTLCEEKILAGINKHPTFFKGRVLFSF
jgi:hypothetical protein